MELERKMSELSLVEPQSIHPKIADPEQVEERMEKLVDRFDKWEKRR